MTKGWGVKNDENNSDIICERPLCRRVPPVLKSIFTFCILTSNIIICMVDNGRYSKWNNALYMCEKNYLVCSYLIKVEKKLSAI